MFSDMQEFCFVPVIKKLRKFQIKYINFVLDRSTAIYYNVRCVRHDTRSMEHDLFPAQIAQLVEQRTENPRVTGSIPVGATMMK